MERGTAGSKSEVVDRKRINEVHDHRAVNGKGKASSNSAKQSHDHHNNRDSRSASLSKTTISDGEIHCFVSSMDMNSLTVVVMGKGSVGKSSTVNSHIGEQVVRVSAFQAEVLRPVMVSRTMGGFTINIIDTPGLVEAGYVNHQALELIKGSISCEQNQDVLLYVDRMDVYRVDELDKQIVQVITQTFGKEIWCKTLLVLTHAQTNCRHLDALPQLTLPGVDNQARGSLELCIDNCKNLQSLQEQLLCYYTSLAYLDLSNHEFERMPTSISKLSTLITLCLNNCKKLKSVEELPRSLNHLYAQGCDSLESVALSPDHMIKHIDLRDCPRF
ncbi:hypothetical protein Bca52824_015022 [Brassica carinata]|uniref:AIG1-type G domain-containing protein n=1 Tax=Brassica carinata TaxID=52824 RepID=A0A8X7W198_BRACI|nr:hypothetical protein Bca52824_015022 [Brassica carinata]